jgi:hypothetical protein
MTEIVLLIKDAPEGVPPARAAVSFSDAVRTMTTSATRFLEMLRQVVMALSAARVAHAVAGGMAVAAHGHVRATKDIDFLIDAADIERADQALTALGFSAEYDDRSRGFLRYQRRPLAGMPELVEWIGLLLARQAVGRDLISHAARHPARWQGIDLPIVSPEGLVLMKLLSSLADPTRTQDRGDIIALLRAKGDAFDRRWVENVATTFGVEHAQTFLQLTTEADTRDRPTAPTGL